MVNNHASNLPRYSPDHNQTSHAYLPAFRNARQRNSNAW